jgi:hypothetical protein
MTTELRNADLAELVGILQEQNAQKLDIVAPSSALFMSGSGQMIVADAEPEGVNADGTLVSSSLFVNPGDIFAEGVSERLQIPIKYYKRMRDEKPVLLAENVNAWLMDSPDRPHLLRCYKREDGSVFGRALLSDRYDRIDNFDTLVGALDAVKEEIPSAIVERADLTERRMRVRITAPEISANIADLVKNYAPVGLGRRGEDYPLLFAGIVIENSETGGGAYSIVPSATVQVCKNGLTRTVDAMRRIHLGSKMEQGRIDWSDETRKANLDLIRSQSRDAVKLFLSEEMLSRFVADMETAAGRVIESPRKTVERIAKTLTFTEEQTDSILGHFLGGNDSSALGLAQALTFASQSFDADLAARVEDEALSLVLA